MAYHIIGKVSAPFLRKTGKKPAYYYYVYDEDRKRVRRSTGMHSRAAAMQVIQERIATGTLISDTLISTRMGSGVKLRDAASCFFSKGRCPIAEEKAFRGRPYTERVLKENRQRLENHILPYLGDMRLSDITVGSVKAWMRAMQNDGLSNATINRVRTTLLPVFDALVDSGQMESNPVRLVKPMAVSAESSREAFTEEEIHALFSVEWKSPLARLMCLTAAFTGMRVGEIRALRPCDITEDAILIRHSVTSGSEIKGTKSGKSRICTVPESLVSALKAYSRGRDDLIFTTNGVTPVSGTYANDYLRDAMARAGIERKGLSFHSFRHYFNSRLVAAGVQGEMVRAVIGHQSEAMTERYLHLRPDQLEAVRNVQKGMEELV